MKYCKHCGNQVIDKAVICPKCGCSIERNVVIYKNCDTYQLNGFAIAGLIFAYPNPLFGLIFGGVGLSKSRDLNGSGKLTSILAIIISSIQFIVVIAILIFVNSHTK